MKFALSLIALTYFVDFYLYWFHVAYHSKKFPLWFRNIHKKHHEHFLKTKIFSLHPVEFIIEVIPGALFVYFVIGLWFVPLAVFWAVFEAARGHGHFLWLKIPKAYYRFFKFCGIRYHLYHHEVDETKNLGQMLKVWDKIMGTMRRDTDLSFASK